MKYQGQDIELITAGYWPEGVELICSYDGVIWHECAEKQICLHNGVAFFDDYRTSARWNYWALKPTRPAPRRLTCREVYKLWRNGWDAKTGIGTVSEPTYSIENENDPAVEGLTLRAPGYDEWLEPTSDLLEMKNG